MSPSGSLAPFLYADLAVIRLTRFVGSRHARQGLEDAEEPLVQGVVVLDEFVVDVHRDVACVLLWSTIRADLVEVLQEGDTRSGSRASTVRRDHRGGSTGLADPLKCHLDSRRER